MVLRRLPCKLCKVWENTSKVINEISVKFAWVFQYIYSFRRQFRREFSTVFLCNFAGTIGWNYGNCPVNLAEFDWVLQKLLMQSTEPKLWQRQRSVFRWYLSQFSTVLQCNFAHTIRSHCGDCPENLVRFDRVFQKLLMWCTETTLFSTSPERWKCGPSLKQHWGSALPPSYMCDWAVRTDKAGRQDWDSNYQHYIDIGPISFFFFFFF